MARPAATPAQREEQRQRIRRAAGELYEEVGISGVSVRAIAERAGISTGTVYSYFANLGELMQSLWQEPVAEAVARLQAIASEHDDPLDRLEALLRGYVDFAIARPDVYRGALLFVRPASLQTPEVQPLDTLPFHRLLVEAIDDGQRAEVIVAGDPAELAQLLWAGLHGAIALPVNIDRYALRRSEELATAMIPLLLGSITTGG